MNADWTLVFNGSYYDLLRSKLSESRPKTGTDHNAELATGSNSSQRQCVCVVVKDTACDVMRACAVRPMFREIDNRSRSRFLINLLRIFSRNL